jgi:hypothetical protein
MGALAARRRLRAREAQPALAQWRLPTIEERRIWRSR